MPLGEQGVVDAIEAWLKESGFSEVEAIVAGARGYDIVARRDATGERWLIEAKGGARSGLDNSNASWGRVGAAFSMTAGWRFQKDIPGERFAIGIPSSYWFDKHLRRLQPALEYLGISVFQVSDDGGVIFTEYCPLKG
ncbi:hypothetical protein [Mesorhizobium erdmanii]|uniref:Uncharacterized protein n=1 Tax=Mesorhizobium erdmanii TaxID=1777866 RepID=A0A6M7UI77_9HYPH|nr:MULTISPECIES: hypothetical protein [Mesorhizobium]OBQ59376.1 hypothetical protein A8146_21055 [Mesorhizobium loti]QKC75848.1 hypothetical protein EB233_10085 [Mesorhizobium erdmanii]